MKVSDLIREFCEIHSDKYSVYENYSGRFMFGAKCMGIIVRQGNSFMAMIAELTSYLDEYADEIKEMQQLIRNITELSAKVETGEKRNKALADKQFSMLKKEVKEAKRSSQMASKYYKSMSQVDFTPQFVDKKN